VRPFFVYMLRCSDGSSYVGPTDDLTQRFAQHQTGAFPGYTRKRRPVELVWWSEMPSRYEAATRELQLKGWSRAKKEALVRGDRERISELGRLSRGKQQDTGGEGS
jgi:tRNA/rRNA methyltransferase